VRARKNQKNFAALAALREKLGFASLNPTPPNPKPPSVPENRLRNHFQINLYQMTYPFKKNALKPAISPLSTSGGEGPGVGYHLSPITWR
jgi:hypothetical protein